MVRPKSTFQPTKSYKQYSTSTARSIGDSHYKILFEAATLKKKKK
uniref:Uncharacterized protein n=1 Tax=Rhizophora mucronata TaxID=61149 RepID=A0A2P2NC82_RHIMU